MEDGTDVEVFDVLDVVEAIDEFDVFRVVASRGTDEVIAVFKIEFE